MNWKLQKEPRWFFEAALALARYKKDSVEEIIKHRIQDGEKREDIEKIFSRYEAYKELVMKEIESLIPDDEWFLSCIEGDEPSQSVYAQFAKYYLFHGECDVSKDQFVDYILAFIEDIYYGWANVRKEVDHFTDFDQLFTAINHSDLEMAEQMVLVTIYHRRAEFYSNTVSLLNRVAKVLKKYAFIVEEDIKQLIWYIEQPEYRERLTKKGFGIELEREDLDISISIMGYNSISYYLEEEMESLTVIVGLYVYQLTEHEVDKKKRERFLMDATKAISDESRLKILRLLQKRPMYVQEIAEELSLTPATVSHHMSLLLQSKLITALIKNEKKRSRLVCYDILPETFKSLADIIYEFTKQIKD
ncbi:arsenical resistance operon repressor [Lachnospiraceae bacterium KM106-2]|nr:arsenical resistance operon repressor [Lachnospiraceae bacterium KM106-2]